jgi:hypothetical protein
MLTLINLAPLITLKEDYMSLIIKMLFSLMDNVELLEKFTSQ